MTDVVESSGTTDTFPRQYARTRRFSLGEPRNLVVSPDGQRVVFVRSTSGDDPINCLYLLHVATGEERLIADPSSLLEQADPDEDLPDEERVRRERMRETASGITTFATDKAVTVVAFPLAGRLFVAGLISGVARELDVEGPVFDPRPHPGAARLAYVCGSARVSGKVRLSGGSSVNGSSTFTMRPSVAQTLREESVVQARQTIERRVNELGVTEPSIAQQGGLSGLADEILVQLPGVTDVERAKEIIGSPGMLELKLVEQGPAARHPL